MQYSNESGAEGVIVPGHENEHAKAERLAQGWLSQLAILPRSSRILALHTLWNRIPYALEEAIGSSNQLSAADIHALGSLALRISSYAHQHLNKNSSVFCLPPEILEEIFFIVRDEYDHDRQHEARTPMEWISVCTHVCRRWREISLDLPLLWTSIDLSQLTADAHHAILQRTRFQGLHVSVSQPSIGLERMENLLRVGASIESLDVKMSVAPEITLYWLRSNTSVTRNLVSLKISVPNCQTARGYDPITPWEPLEDRLPRPALVKLSLADCSFPVLRELVLINCTIFLRDEMVDAATAFPQLERLVIDCHLILGMAYPRPIQRAPDRPFFSDLLALTPRLRDLFLGRAFATLLSVPNVNVQPIRLPPLLERISIVVVNDLRNMHFLDAIQSLNLKDVPRLAISLRIARVYRRAYRMRTLQMRDLIAYLMTQRDVHDLSYIVSPASSRKVGSQQDVAIHAYGHPDDTVRQGGVHVLLEDYPRVDLLTEIMKGLPHGWEERAMPSGQFYYVNHNTATRTYDDPRTSPQHYCPLTSIESLTLQVAPPARTDIDTPWWFKNFNETRRVREVRVKGGFDSAFTLIRALSSSGQENGVLFPDLVDISIEDDGCDVGGVVQTIGWRRVRALQRCLARDKSLSGVARIRTLSLPMRFEAAKWVPHLRDAVERLQFL